MKKRLIGIGGCAVVVIALVWVLVAYLGHRSSLEYSGTVETREIQIGSKVGGRVTAVPVEEGQLVKAGTLLVRFECDELKAQRAQAAASVEQAQADIDRMLSGNRPEEIEQAEAAAKAQREAYEAARNGPRKEDLAQGKADYEASKADAVNSEAYFHRMEKLVEVDTISRQQFDDAREKRDAANERAESARQHLAELEAGTRPEELRAAEARFRQAQAAAVLSRKGFRKEEIEAAHGRLAEAQGKLAELDVRLKEAELLAPADATIEVVSIRPGDLVPAGQIVVKMQESSQIWVKVYIPETELARVHLGQAASIRVDGADGRVFNGHVGQIASEAEFLPRNVQTLNDREHLVFGVKILIDNPGGVLKSGMSASVRLP
jgi:multidrug resistance efflux pump